MTSTEVIGLLFITLLVSLSVQHSFKRLIPFRSPEMEPIFKECLQKLAKMENIGTCKENGQDALTALDESNMSKFCATVPAISDCLKDRDFDCTKKFAEAEKPIKEKCDDIESTRKQGEPQGRQGSTTGEATSMNTTAGETNTSTTAGGEVNIPSNPLEVREHLIKCSNELIEKTKDATCKKNAPEFISALDTFNLDGICEFGPPILKCMHNDGIICGKDLEAAQNRLKGFCGGGESTSDVKEQGDTDEGHIAIGTTANSTCLTMLAWTYLVCFSVGIFLCN